MAIIPPKRLTATLLETKPLTDNLKWFRFQLSVPIDFYPGQYISLRFPGELRYHSFSIASSPAKKDEVELVIKLEKEFTSRTFQAAPGAQYEALAPMGRFMENPQGDVVMIAGGVGVTPFLGMVRWARDAPLHDRQYWLFYSCRTRADIFNEEELRAAAAANPNVHVIFTITRETPAGWQDELGHVDEKLLTRYLDSLKGKSFYTCGPGRLIDAMKTMLGQAGVPQERILTESWG